VEFLIMESTGYVNEAQKVASRFPFFRLPPELQVDVIKHAGPIAATSLEDIDPYFQELMQEHGKGIQRYHVEQYRAAAEAAGL
jgi:hypothetical protein